MSECLKVALQNPPTYASDEMIKRPFGPSCFYCLQRLQLANSTYPTLSPIATIWFC